MRKRLKEHQREQLRKISTKQAFWKLPHRAANRNSLPITIFLRWLLMLSFLFGFTLGTAFT